MTKQWIFPIANFLFKGSMGIFADYKAAGKENIPTSGPLIVVSNHLATVDPAVVASALSRSPLFMAKKELFSNPVMRFLLAGYGVHPLDRTGADLAALNWAKSQLVDAKPGGHPVSGRYAQPQPDPAVRQAGCGAPRLDHECDRGAVRRLRYREAEGRHRSREADRDSQAEHRSAVQDRPG